MNAKKVIIKSRSFWNEVHKNKKGVTLQIEIMTYLKLTHRDHCPHGVATILSVGAAIGLNFGEDRLGKVLELCLCGHLIPNNPFRVRGVCSL